MRACRPSGSSRCSPPRRLSRGASEVSQYVLVRPDAVSHPTERDVDGGLAGRRVQRGDAVGDERHVVAELDAHSSGRVDAGVRDGAGDEQVRHATRLQLVFEVGPVKDVQSRPSGQDQVIILDQRLGKLSSLASCDQ